MAHRKQAAVWVITALVAMVCWAGMAQASLMSRLSRSSGILSGSIEAIDPAAKTFILRDARGLRRTIHYNHGTVVFTPAAAIQASDVREGAIATVRCSRHIVEAQGAGAMCRMEIVADRVYIDETAATNSY